MSPHFVRIANKAKTVIAVGGHFVCIADTAKTKSFKEIIKVEQILLKKIAV